MINRRDFIRHAGCGIFASSLIAHPLRVAARQLRGSGAIPTASQGSVVNIQNSSLYFINCANSWQPVSNEPNWPSFLTSDGYPNDPIGTLLKQGISDGGGQLDPTYYGHYKVGWKGTGAIWFNGLPAIVYANGRATNVGASAGLSSASFAIGWNSRTQPTIVFPVEFAFGCLAVSVSAGGGALTVQNTACTVNGSSGVPTGTNIKFGIGASPNLQNGPNFDGSWTVTNVDAMHFTLNNSSGVTSPSIVGSGGVGTQTEIFFSVAACGRTFPNGAVFRGFSGMVFTEAAYYSAAIAGQYAHPRLITQMQTLKPKFIRVMNTCGVIGDKSVSYDHRTLVSNLYWGSYGKFDSGYWVGAASNKGAGNGYSDVYQCSNPKASPSSGTFQDGEIAAIYVPAGSANAGCTPALQIPGRGIAPILNPAGASQSQPGSLFVGGRPPTAGTVITLRFTGAGLSDTYSTTYTVRSSDNSSNLWGNVANHLRANTKLRAAGIWLPYYGGAPGAALTFSYNPNIGGLGSSPLGLTVSDIGGATTYTVGTMQPNSIRAGMMMGLTYSALIGAWLPSCDTATSFVGSYGVHGGAPLEFYVDLCNRVGCGLYLNIGQFWNASRISSTVAYLAENLNGQLVLEYSNETWNKGTNPEWQVATLLGTCLGITSNIGNQDISQDSLTGLRFTQIAQLAAAAWTGAGRARSDLKMNLAYWFLAMSATPNDMTKNRMFGAQLNPANNSTLASFGGIGVTAETTSYSSGQNRPVMFADTIGGAPYFTGQTMNAGMNGLGSGLVTGRDFRGNRINISAYNTLLLHSWNHAHGSPSDKSAALDWLFDGTNGDLYNGTLNGTYNNNYQLASWNIVSADRRGVGFFQVGEFCSSLDATRSGYGLPPLGRVDYEGNLQWAPSLAIGGEINNLIRSLNTLGDTLGYTSSLPGAVSGGTSSVDSDAQNIQNLMQAFLVDSRASLLCQKYLEISLQSGQWNGSALVTSRLSLPSTFGLDGPNDWQLYGGDAAASVPQPNGLQAGVVAFN